MEIQLRVGRSVPLAEHWQQQQQQRQLDRETKALYARARGRCFNVAFATRPAALASLVFRNFYAASLRLVQQNVDGSTLVLLDEYPLMRHAHCEDDAQDWHVIHLDKQRVKPDVARLESLHVYVLQPSPLFESWELQHLKLFESRATGGQEAADEPTSSRVETTTDKSSERLATPPPSMHQLMRRLSRSSLLVVDARDVRESASQIVSLVYHLRQLVHSESA